MVFGAAGKGDRVDTIVVEILRQLNSHNADQYGNQGLAGNHHCRSGRLPKGSSRRDVAIDDRDLAFQ